MQHWPGVPLKRVLSCWARDRLIAMLLRTLTAYPHLRLTLRILLTALTALRCDGLADAEEAG